MRLPIAAGTLLLIAFPAAAQRLDTRRIEVNHDAGAFDCRFNAFPMTLSYVAGDATSGMADWRAASAVAAGGNAANLTIAFRQAKGDWRTPPIFAILFAIPEADLPDQSRLPLRASIDGSSPVELSASWTVDGDRVLYAIEFGLAAFGHGLIGADTLRLDLADSDGKVVRSYPWDLHRLRDAAEAVSIVDWSCTTP